jgi:hypothetical protein
VFGYQQWIGQIKHTTSEASKQAGYWSVWSVWRMDVNVECLTRKRKDWILMLAGNVWSSRPIEYRMVSSFCRVADCAERSGRQWSIRTNLMNQLGECELLVITAMYSASLDALISRRDPLLMIPLSKDKSSLH